MKCRALVPNKDPKDPKKILKQNIVWFGSCGKDEFGNKLPYENYATKQEGVAASLIQRLSVIKGELWYKASYGLPLMEKIKNKGIYDSIIINIISSHPDVIRIIDFDSKVLDRKYSLNFTVYTTYKEELKISYII